MKFSLKISLFIIISTNSYGNKSEDSLSCVRTSGLRMPFPSVCEQPTDLPSILALYDRSKRWIPKTPPVEKIEQLTKRFRGISEDTFVMLQSDAFNSPEKEEALKLRKNAFQESIGIFKNSLINKEISYDDAFEKIRTVFRNRHLILEDLKIHLSENLLAELNDIAGKSEPATTLLKKLRDERMKLATTNRSSEVQEKFNTFHKNHKAFIDEYEKARGQAISSRHAKIEGLRTKCKSMLSNEYSLERLEKRVSEKGFDNIFKEEETSINKKIIAEYKKTVNSLLPKESPYKTYILSKLEKEIHDENYPQFLDTLKTAEKKISTLQQKSQELQAIPQYDDTFIKQKIHLEEKMDQKSLEQLKSSMDTIKQKAQRTNLCNLGLIKALIDSVSQEWTYELQFSDDQTEFCKKVVPSKTNIPGIRTATDDNISELYKKLESNAKLLGPLFDKFQNYISQRDGLQEHAEQENVADPIRKYLVAILNLDNPLRAEIKALSKIIAPCPICLTKEDPIKSNRKCMHQYICCKKCNPHITICPICRKRPE